MKVQVAMVDTEVHEHPLLRDVKINNLWKSDDSNSCWHGTAVCGEICQVCNEVEIDIYPIFSNNEADPEEIINILKNILMSEKMYHVINMSLGVQDASWSYQFEEICDKFAQKGTIIVAAFNNDGSMTYPACLSSVIGVDLSAQMPKGQGYTYIEGGVVNILGPLEQRCVIYKDGRKLVIGSSFLCGYITGVICQYIYSVNGKYKRKDVLGYLQLKAIRTESFNSAKTNQCSKIEKAILFPYSKELESVIKLHEFLCFEMLGIYDLKYSIFYGKEIETFDRLKYKVESIDKIDWSGFDTLILGHIDNYVKASLSKYIEKIIEKCVRYSKKIYALDEEILKLYQFKWPELKELVYYPKVDQSFFPHAQLGKMWSIPVPIVAIFGTRSQQGKFTTQIHMYNYLLSKGYSVGMITSEPTGGLFGADCIFPYGYHKTVSVPSDEYAIYINDMMYKSFLKGRDIIIFSAQTSTLPRHYFNMNQCTTMQYSLLFGMSPDMVILCVSPDDTIDLILRTISSIEAFSQAVVKCLLVNPVVVNIDENGKTVKENILVTNKRRMDEFIIELSQNTNISIYVMNVNNVKRMTEDIISDLAE